MGRMLRPRATVLPESALVPERNLLQPPPNKFTHKVIADQPYYYATPGEKDAPDGTFPAGTKVVVLSHDGSSICDVADSRGLRVVTAFNGLQPIR